MAQQTASDTRRVVGLLDKSIAGPVASLWVSALHRGRTSDSGAPGGLSWGQQSCRFCTTKTENAMDSILPSAPEEWLRGLLEERSKFGNPAKLKFRYSAH